MKYLTPTRPHRLALVFACVFSLAACAKTPPVKPLLSEHKFNKSAEGLLLGATGGGMLGAFASGVGSPGSLLLGGSLGAGAGLPVGILVGGVVGGAVGAQFSTATTPIARLAKSDIHVFKVGDEYRIIIPAYRIFVPHTPNIRGSGHQILNDVSAYLRGFHKESVKVAAYTNKDNLEKFAVPLTRQQAENVSQYLWQQGIDSRFISAVGYGAQFPLSHSESWKGAQVNRRIEITTRAVT